MAIGPLNPEQDQNVPLPQLLSARSWEGSHACRKPFASNSGGPGFRRQSSTPRRRSGRGTPGQPACGYDGQAAARLAHIPTDATAATGKSIQEDSGGLNFNQNTSSLGRQSVRKAEATSLRQWPRYHIRDRSLDFRSQPGGRVRPRCRGGARSLRPRLSHNSSCRARFTALWFRR